VDGDGQAPSWFHGAFSVDVEDVFGSDSRLTLAEMCLLSPGAAGCDDVDLSDVIDARLDATADVNLTLVVSFDSDVANANFPKLLADLNLGWSFSSDDPDLSGGKPSVAFNNVRLDIGSFLTSFVAPIIEKIDTVLKPIRPVIQVLTRRLPVLSDIALARDYFDVDKDGKVTLVDLAKKRGAPHLEFLDTVAAISDLLDRVDSIATTDSSGKPIFVRLGGFDLGTSDVRFLHDLTTIGPNITGTVARHGRRCVRVFQGA
jgi:hypothetical protein